MTRMNPRFDTAGSYGLEKLEEFDAIPPKIIVAGWRWVSSTPREDGGRNEEARRPPERERRSCVLAGKNPCSAQLGKR
jgi:hypothetical protein